MSAMSASSGLLPLSLISEHKAAQGGPTPVQQLAYAPEKHSLVQAPKPTPNGMEPSPPLIPVMPPSQPEPQPSLPCGGVSESISDEERSGGVVPEVAPVEPSPPVVPAFIDQLPATESAAEPPSLAVVAPSSTAQSAPAPLLLNQRSEPPTASTPSVPSQIAPIPAASSPASLASEPPAVALPQAAAPEQSLPVPIQEEPQQAATIPEVQQPASEAPVPTPTFEEQAAEPPKPQPALAPVVQASTKSSTDIQANIKTQEDEPVKAESDKVSDSQLTVTPTPAAPSVGRLSKRTKATSEKKSAPTTAASEQENSDDKRAKRKRLPTQVYQSPIPEENIIAKINKIDKTPAVDDKLIVFYRNEFLAVRNTEGGFYVCQAMQNVYKSSARIRIRWLSQVQNTDHYSPDFYDTTEFDCILTNLNLERIEKNKYRLPDVESQRTQSILKRAIDVENGVAPAEETAVTEEHPDGLDLSLYRNEDQLKTRKKGGKINKKKIKKVVAEGMKKSSREVPKRNKVIEPKKTNSVVQNQSKRIVGRIAKVDKPVVQRIVAAKKMGRRKAASTTTNNKASPSTPPAPKEPKEVAKKKETTRSAAVKRKSSEPQTAPVPDKKLKTGASKTRSGVAGGPSGPQQQQPQRASRRSTNRTK